MLPSVSQVPIWGFPALSARLTGFSFKAVPQLEWGNPGAANDHGPKEASFARPGCASKSFGVFIALRNRGTGSTHRNEREAIAVLKAVLLECRFAGADVERYSVGD